MSVSPRLGADPRRLGRTTWKEWAIRFGFGGAVAVAAGLVAHQFGPSLGGLFLAFPAILPASLTLIEDHTDKTRAAGANAVGARAGALGLMAFGLVVWLSASQWPAWLVLAAALCAWLAVSLATWLAFELARRDRNHEPAASASWPLSKDAE